MSVSNSTNESTTTTVDKPLSLRKASIYLGVTPGILSRIAERGEIQHSRIGHKFQFSMLDLDLYRAEHTVTKEGQA